jgi:hypothetical protein
MMAPIKIRSLRGAGMLNDLSKPQLYISLRVPQDLHNGRGNVSIHPTMMITVATTEDNKNAGDEDYNIFCNEEPR